MIAKFKMELSDGFYYESLDHDYERYGYERKFFTERTIHNNLKKYLLVDGSLDAKQIEEDWFPNIHAKVFLSHSHADEQKVISFAGYLQKEFGITSFIDSALWGYADDLLKRYDNRYCVKKQFPDGNKIYSYKKRNISTSHIHMLLQGALAKMIDRCECLIFINTPNSIKFWSHGDDSLTASPWIYNELLMANLLRTKELSVHRKDELLHYSIQEGAVSYPVQLKSFVDLKYTDFVEAKKQVNRKEPDEILKQLYINKGIIKRNDSVYANRDNT